MPSKMKDEFVAKSRTTKQAQKALSTAGTKAPGTRIGVYTDWRSAAAGNRSGRYGRSLRDGR